MITQNFHLCPKKLAEGGIHDTLNRTHDLCMSVRIQVQCSTTKLLQRKFPVEKTLCSEIYLNRLLKIVLWGSAL